MLFASIIVTDCILTYLASLRHLFTLKKKCYIKYPIRGMKITHSLKEKAI